MKPLVPSVSQIARVLHQPVNSGFFVLNVGGAVEVVEITVNPETGEILSDGKLLEYETRSGEKFTYQVVRV